MKDASSASIPLHLSRAASDHEIKIKIYDGHPRNDGHRCRLLCIQRRCADLLRRPVAALPVAQTHSIQHRGSQR